MAKRRLATYFCVRGRLLTLLIREEDVRALLPMSKAVELIEAVLRLQAAGEAENRPRVRIPCPGGVFQYMAAAIPTQSSAGMKAYLSTRQGTHFVVLLFDSDAGNLISIIEADWLGRIRTGAASGVATKFLARSDAAVAGVIGAGGQAETQIEALAVARPLTAIKIFSRTPAHREELASRINEQLDVQVAAVSSAREAVEGSDIVTTITTAGEPVFDGSWLAPGTHINAAGGNRANRREIDSTTVSRAGIIGVDSVEQARIESGDLLLAASDGEDPWERVVELGSIIARRTAGRASTEEITLFESQGIALEDVAAARFVYDRAREEGRGEDIDFGGKG